MTTRLQGVDQFQSAFSRWAQTEPRARVHQAVRFLGLEALRRVILRSPVDQGRYRANHRLSLSTPVEIEIETEDVTGAATLAAGTAVVQSIQDTGPFLALWLANPASHAAALEFGHSSQAPLGIYGITFAELAQAVVPPESGR
jgi:hypothetical protein